jgi:uncharacterized membrane protein YkgB
MHRTDAEIPTTVIQPVNHCLPSSVLWFNRLALFVIFFWFGALKVFAASPAEALITHLHRLTLYNIVSIHTFLVTLGVIECLIGILWLFPRLTRIVIVIFTVQMTTTFLPLILLPSETWHNILILSLPGQYILKNIVLVASAFTLYKDCQIRGWSPPQKSLASFFAFLRH